MGLVAGVLLKNQAEDINTILHRMIEIQKHRDNGLPITYIEDNLALGMVNSQNNIFNVRNNNTCSTEIKNSKKNVYSLVDGIVLDIPKHWKYFNETGFTMKAPSCSAIVEAAYKKWGLNFMEHLEGEFSCVVWDCKEKKLILVRDPFGHKPLHYYVDENIVIFSSEIKGILTIGISKEIDLISLNDFLSLNCIPYPATIFKDIKQVVPGNMVIISSNGISNYKYWRHKFETDYACNFNEAVLQLTDRIKDAVKKRMISKDTYCFLSGGIDSSALIAFASELSDKPINAITVSFEDEEVDELKYATTMANYVGARHHHIVARPDTFLNMLDTLVFHHDSPFTDTSAYPTYYAAKLARGFTDVILTGDGPDQSMGGSGHHIFAVKNKIFQERSEFMRFIYRLGTDCISLFINEPRPHLFPKIKRKLYRNSLFPVSRAYELRSFFPDIIKKFICTNEMWKLHLKNNPYRHPESWFREVGETDDINKYLFADIKFYVTDDLMIKVDRMCMAHNLETLSPFQDIHLARFVNRLPGKYKINVSSDKKITTKYILKKICQNRFPETILTKKKQGFGIPLDKWLRQDNGKYLREILFDNRTLKRNYFKKESFKKFVNDFIDNKGDYFYPSSGGIVALLTLELWHRRYID